VAITLVGAATETDAEKNEKGEEGIQEEQEQEQEQEQEHEQEQERDRVCWGEWRG
jgi:hypothetical protein